MIYSILESWTFHDVYIGQKHVELYTKANQLNDLLH